MGFLRPGVALCVSLSAQGIPWFHDTTLAGVSRYNRPLRNSSLSLLSLFSPFLPSDDHSRVRLQLLDGDPHSDYINANYIDVRLLDIPPVTNPLWQASLWAWCLWHRDRLWSWYEWQLNVVQTPCCDREKVLSLQFILSDRSGQMEISCVWQIHQHKVGRGLSDRCRNQYQPLTIALLTELWCRRHVCKQIDWFFKWYKMTLEKQPLSHRQSDPMHVHFLNTALKSQQQQMFRIVSWKDKRCP